jgi:hypothetical protein
LRWFVVERLDADGHLDAGYCSAFWGKN